MRKRTLARCMFCGGTRFRDVFEYTTPPKGETSFGFLRSGKYYRKVIACEVCGHFYSTHQMELGPFYSGEYNNFTYQGIDGMRRIFERIIELDPVASDNIGRCNRIESFLRRDNCEHLPGNYKILDVGSGLGVFPYVMAKRGYSVTALDPDPRAAEHIQRHVGVDTLCGDFFKVTPPERYDLITFNKVLEHVEDPVVMLQRAAAFLNKNGILYIELPDGEMAQNEGPDREEFFIDHVHVFSIISVALLASCSNFSALQIERLREPSAKFTLRAFLTENQ